MLFSKIDIIDHEGRIKKDYYLATLADTIVWLDGNPPPEDFLPPGTEIFDGRGKVLLPGLYNMHCHVPMTLLRGYGEGLPLQRWLRERIFPFEALMDEEDMYWGSLLGIYEMLASGVVSFSDMYMRLDGIARAVLESGIKANLSNPLTGGEQMDIRRDNAYLEVMKILREAKSSQGKIMAEASLHAVYSCTEQIARDVGDWAKEDNLNIQLHLSETKKENEDCLKKYKKTPTAFFDSLGLFERPVVAAHCVHLAEEDFEILKNKDVTVAHCPSSNLKLGSGIAPVKRILAEGIRLTIGTDGASSNNNLNLLEEIHLAALLAKGSSHDASLLPAKDLLPLVTSNGALAQGRENSGRLELGAKADLFVLDLDRAHLRPVYDLFANVFFSAQSADVSLTMVDGQVLYKNGEALGIDLQRVLFEVERIRGKKLELLR